MSQKIIQDDGTELEVFTAEEVQAQIAVKEEEFGKTKAEIEADLAETKKALGERSGEFKQFRRLTDEAVAKLGLAEKTIYENTLLMEDMRVKSLEHEKLAKEASLDSILRARAGGDEKIFQKLKDVYSVIAIDAQTPEQVNMKINMALGAIGTTEPDLLASIGSFAGGSFKPAEEKKETTDFADTDKGKALANALGLKLTK